ASATGPGTGAMTERGKSPATRAKPATAPRRAAAAKATATTEEPAPIEDLGERPGPADAHSATFWLEIRRAFIWVCVVGAAALMVLLIEPILLILGSIVIAVVLDGGTRLLGRVLPIARGARLALVTLAVFLFLLWTIYLTGTNVAQQATQLPALIESQVG